MEVAVLVGVDGVDFQPHHAEVLPGQLAGLADVLHRSLMERLSPVSSRISSMPLSAMISHLVLDLFHGELHPVDVVVAVEAAVDAVVLAVVGDVQGGEQVDRVAKVLSGLQPGPLGHLLQKGLRRRGEQGLKVLDGAGVVVQGGPHVPGGVAGWCRRLSIWESTLSITSEWSCSMPGRYSMWLFREEGSVSSWCFRARAWGERNSESTKKLVFLCCPAPLVPEKAGEGIGGRRPRG